MTRTPVDKFVDLPIVQPVHSDRIVDAYGVNVHTLFAQTNYAHLDTVYGLLQDLGVRYVRDRVPDAPTRAGLAGAGVKIHATISKITDSPASVASTVRVVNAESDRFISVAGPNEPQNYGAGWAGQAWALTNAIRQAGPAVPVVAPALKEKVPDLEGDYAKMGQTGVWQVVDFGDYHNYPGPMGPSTDQDRITGLASAAYGGRPLYNTEGGYNTTPRLVGQGGVPVNETIQAAYLPRLLMETFNRGVVRQFSYELLDMAVDSTGSNWSNHWGLVATPAADPATWRVKPAYTAMQTLLADLADPGPVFTPAPGRLEVLTDQADVRWVYYGKRSGRRGLLLWRDLPYSQCTPASVTIRTRRGDKTVQVSTEVLNVSPLRPV